MCKHIKEGLEIRLWNKTYFIGKLLMLFLLQMYIFCVCYNSH